MCRSQLLLVLVQVLPPTLSSRLQLFCSPQTPMEKKIKNKTKSIACSGKLEVLPAGQTCCKTGRYNHLYLPCLHRAPILLCGVTSLLATCRSPTLQTSPCPFNFGLYWLVNLEAIFGDRGRRGLTHCIGFISIETRLKTLRREQKTSVSRYYLSYTLKHHLRSI